MSNTVSPLPDFGAMINEYLAARQDAIIEFMKPIQDAVTHAFSDAFLVTALAVILIGAILCVIYGMRSGVWHVLLPCLAVGAVLVLLASQALFAFPFTWGSAGLGFLMIGMIIMRGHRFVLRLLRFVDV